MPNLHVSDTTDAVRPLALIAGSFPQVTRAFIDPLLSDFKCIILNNPHKYPSDPNVFQVYTTAIGTITALSDKIEYAVFFLSTPEDKKILEKLIPKLEKDKPKTVIVIRVEQYAEFSDVLLAVKSIPSVSFAFLGEVFGSDVPPLYSRVSLMVHSARTQKKAAFVGTELVSVYPISKDDVLKGINYVLFSKEKKERVFFLFYEHPQTIISTIHLLKRIEPDLHILQDTHAVDFPPLLTHKELEQKIQKTAQLSSRYLEDVLEGFEKSVEKTYYSASVKSPQKKRRTRMTKNLPQMPKSFTQSAITATTLGILLFLLMNVLLTASGIIFAKQAIASLKSGEFQKAKKQLDIAQSSFRISQPVVNLGFELFIKLPIPGITESYQLFTSGVTITSVAAEELSKMNTLHTGVPEADLVESLATLRYLYFVSQFSSAYSRIPYLDSLKSQTTSDVLAASSVLPEILGYKGEKRYLLLFQNNGELRPTGGFIGSVGEILVENGRVEDFTIQDVYDIDGQIKKHTPPPFVVRRYLQPHLYLRDSNFALDFQEAATTAAQLYVDGGGNKVDGVVGIDYEVLKTIIEKTGPLYLPTYNRTIDSKTGFEFIHSTIEDTFSPGNSQKKGVLTEIFTQLTIKLQDSKHILAVVQAFPELIAQKHILFAFKDPSTQEIFTAQKFGGTLAQSAVNSPGINDYFSVNEANIGANKANVYVSRSENLSQTLQKNSLNSRASLRLDNTQGKEDYKVYVRYVVPLDNEFKSLTINGKGAQTVPAVTSPRLYEATSFTPPKSIELTEEVYQGKKVFGFIHTVISGEKDTLTLEYSRKIQLPQDTFTYTLSVQPQPGTVKTPFTFDISFPTEYRAKEEQTGISTQKKLSLSEILTKDRVISIDFQK